MTINEKLFQFIPEKYFVKSLKENRIGQIKLAFVRETINPLIIRSTDSEATITLIRIDGRELVEIPPRKLKSREKLLGLMICREFGVVDESVRYNLFDGAKHLNNPNSIVFGDTSTKSGDTAGLVSRAIYDWAYSLRDVKDITDKLQHNALSEAGTMIDETTGEMRQSLFSTEYVLPNTFFPHFITVDNITPELFLHLLFCVLHQRRYGAQTTTMANNLNNHLVAIGYSDFEKPINSFTVSKNWDETNGKKSNAATLSSVTEFVQERMADFYKKNLITSKTDKKIPDLIKWVEELWEDDEKTKDRKPELKQIYSSAKESVDSYLKEIKMITDKEPKAKRGKPTPKTDTKPETGTENQDENPAD